MKTSTLSGIRFFKVKNRLSFLFFFCALFVGVGSVSVNAQSCELAKLFTGTNWTKNTGNTTGSAGNGSSQVNGVTYSYLKNDWWYDAAGKIATVRVQTTTTGFGTPSIYQSGITLENGATYTLTFQAANIASTQSPIAAQLQSSAGYCYSCLTVGTGQNDVFALPATTGTLTTFTRTFTMNSATDANAQLIFKVGEHGSAAYMITNVSLVKVGCVDGPAPACSDVFNYSTTALSSNLSTSGSATIAQQNWCGGGSEFITVAGTNNEYVYKSVTLTAGNTYTLYIESPACGNSEAGDIKPFYSASDGTSPQYGTQVNFPANAAASTSYTFTAPATGTYRVGLQKISHSGSGVAVSRMRLEECLPAGPTITVSSAAIPALTACTEKASETPQSFTVSGAALTPASGSITVTAPTGYVLCTTSVGTYTSSVTVSYTGGTLASTTMYIKLTGNTATASLGATISISGGGIASPITKAVTGTVQTAATITATPATISLKNLTVAPTTYDTKSFTVGGDCWAGTTVPLVLTGKTDYEFRIAGGTWGTANITASKGDVIEVRLKTTSPVGTYNTTITTGGSTLVTVNGTVANKTPETFYAIATGNWNTTSTWSMSSCGGTANATGTPTAVDIVVICEGKVVTIPASQAAACSTLTVIGTNNTARLRFAGGSSLNVTGNATIGDSNGGAIDTTGTAGTRTLTVGGELKLGNKDYTAIELGSQGSLTANSLTGWGSNGGGEVRAKNITVNSSVTLGSADKFFVTLYNGGVMNIQGSLDGNTGKIRMNNTTSSATINVRDDYTTGSRDATLLDLGPLGKLTVGGSATIGGSNGGTIKLRDLEVGGSFSTGNADKTFLTTYSGGKVTIGGNLTLGGSNGGTIDMTAGNNAILTVVGNLTLSNSEKVHLKVGSAYNSGSSVTKVGGNFTMNANTGSFVTRTLEFTGCTTTQSITVAKDITVDTLRQVGAGCSAGSYGGTMSKTLKFSIYDQNCNPVALAGNAAQTAWASNFSGDWTSGVGRIKVVCGPTITVTGTLGTFSTCKGTASAYQTFTVKGESLSAALVVGGLTGYEFATVAGGPYQTTPLSFTPVSQVVTERTIYVRLTGATATTYAAATIPIRSTNAVNKDIDIGIGTVKAAPTLTQVTTTGFGAQNQGLCPGGTLTQIAYDWGGGATGVTVDFSPAANGLSSATVGNRVTIAGTPTADVTYTITSTGHEPCAAATVTGNITVGGPVITPSVNSKDQTVCGATAIAPITFTVTGATSMTIAWSPATISGMSFTSGTSTVKILSGTPSETATYTITTSGGACDATITGTITRKVAPTLTRLVTGGAATQTPCAGNAINPITYTYAGGATGAAVTFDPAGGNGLTAAPGAGSTVVISGTPTGDVAYSIVPTGFEPCAAIAAQTGSITVNRPTIARSGGGAQDQSVCAGDAISPIDFTASGTATGMSISWTPDISADMTLGTGTTVRTLSGAPSKTSTYTITTSGGTCGTASITETITVKPPTLIVPATVTGVAMDYLVDEGPSNVASFTIGTECFVASCGLTLSLSGADADKFELLTTSLSSAGGTVSVRFKAGYDIGTYNDAAITATTGTPCGGAIRTATIPLTGTVASPVARNFFYTGMGDWNNTTGNWKNGSCGGATFSPITTLPTKYDNVTICNDAIVTIPEGQLVERIGTFTINSDDNHKPAQLFIKGILSIPHNFNVVQGQITIAERGILDVIGNFTFSNYINKNYMPAKPSFILNQGVINVTNGGFQMNPPTGLQDLRFLQGAYFSNEGTFNLISSNFEINNGGGVFFYNEDGGKITIDNTLDNTKKVSINGIMGRDANCDVTPVKYCNGSGPTTEVGSGKNCTVLTGHMLTDIAKGESTPDENMNSRIYFNAGSEFVVINNDVSINLRASEQTNTLGGKIWVQDGNLTINNSLGGGAGLRFRLLQGAGLYVYGDAPKGMLSVNDSGGGSQLFVSNEAQLFARGIAASSGGGCNGFNFEQGSTGFIGDMAATVDNQFKIHVLGGSKLYYCGNRTLNGDKVGYVFAGGKLYYTSEAYRTPEQTPITNVSGQDFTLNSGASADSVQPVWTTSGECQAAFEDMINGGFLPIALVEFTAELKGTAVVLGWSTLSETNNDYFTVQRSGSGIHFESLAEILGAGTTVVPQYYGYVDENPLAGISYYRLKQTDFNSEYSYSHVVPVYIKNSAGNAFEVSKTTANGITRLECKFADAAGSNHVSIHAVTGKLLYETTVAPHNAACVVELPLPSGVYLVSNVSSNGVKTVVKVLVSN